MHVNNKKLDFELFLKNLPFTIIPKKEIPRYQTNMYRISMHENNKTLMKELKDLNITIKFAYKSESRNHIH